MTTYIMIINHTTLPPRLRPTPSLPSVNILALLPQANHFPSVIIYGLLPPPGKSRDARSFTQRVARTQWNVDP